MRGSVRSTTNGSSGGHQAAPDEAGAGRPESGPDQDREVSRPARSMVLLVEPARLTRESLASLIRSRAPDLRVEMLPLMVDAPGDVPGIPAVVVVNAKSQDLGDPQLEAGAIHLQQIWPNVPRLLISEQNGESSVALRAIRLGWHGFFPATLDIDLLIAAVRLVCVQGLFIPPAAVQDCAMRAPAATSPNHLAGAEA